MTFDIAKRGLASLVKRKALEAGAQLAGIAPADPPVEKDYFRVWLAEGRQGSMGYMAKEPEVRTDLRRWYPEAKSVLVCAFGYAANDEPEPAGPAPHGKIARYAVLPDYHPLLKAKLGGILDSIRSEVPEADGRVFVDTSPVLEKAFARYAGIGWMGKNTLLIHPKLGSYFFLAGLALNLELEADEPVPDHCGTCTRCLDACPTDAFPGPHEIDASRCIAYFTIEHRGPIPDPFRAGIGDWIFGCDVCQEVCPWNKFAVRPRLPEFREPSMPRLSSLRSLLETTPETFRPLKKTPVERARWRGWIRNVLLAIGNAGDRALAPHLEPWTRHDDLVLSEQARTSLEKLKAAAA